MKDTNRLVNKKRRDFLSMVARASISTAAIRSSALVGGLLANRFALAQGEVKRLVILHNPNGSPTGHWLPNGNKLAGATAAYEGLQNVCNFRETTVVRSGHGNARKALSSLRGNRDWTGDTLDQQVASIIGTTTPYEMYALGANTEIGGVIGKKNGRLVACQDSPSEAYKQLFGGAAPAASGGGNGNLLARKQSVFDANREALNSLKNKIGQYEREMLDSHLEALEKLEKRTIDLLGMDTGSQSSEACESPAWNANHDVNTKQFGLQVQLQGDNLVNALACGLTNVMTLQMSTSKGEWTAHNTRYRGTYHRSCHAAPMKDYVELTNYISSLNAYVIRQLMQRDDPAVPGTKLIDNTVVLQTSDMGSGRTHNGNNGPSMLCTKMSGFKQGTVSSGGDNRQMLEAVAEGMGLGQFKGKDGNKHKIWPFADGKVTQEVLA